jgi:hypothetical protein
MHAMLVSPPVAVATTFKEVLPRDGTPPVPFAVVLYYFIICVSAKDTRGEGGRLPGAPM